MKRERVKKEKKKEKQYKCLPRTCSQRSKVWKYFLTIDLKHHTEFDHDHVACQLCGKAIPYIKGGNANTTTLSRHLQTHIQAGELRQEDLDKEEEIIRFKCLPNTKIRSSIIWKYLFLIDPDCHPEHEENVQCQICYKVLRCKGRKPNQSLRNHLHLHATKGEIEKDFIFHRHRTPTSEKKTTEKTSRKRKVSEISRKKEKKRRKIDIGEKIIEQKAQSQNKGEEQQAKDENLKDADETEDNTDNEEDADDTNDTEEGDTEYHSNDEGEDKAIDVEDDINKGATKTKQPTIDTNEDEIVEPEEIDGEPTEEGTSALPNFANMLTTDNNKQLMLNVGLNIILQSQGIVADQKAVAEFAGNLHNFFTSCSKISKSS